MKEERNPNGIVSLSERVQMLERRVKGIEKEIRKRGCGEEDHFIRLIDQNVRVRKSTGWERTGVLKEVGRYTVILEDDAGQYTINKTHIDEMRLVTV